MKLVRLRLFFCWVFVACCRLSNGVVGEEFLTNEEALKLAFPQADSFEIHLIITTKEQRATIAERLEVRLPSRFFKYYRVKKDGELIGRAIVDEADGKYHPFGYLLAVDPSHEVLSVEVLNYHEKYGFEVKQDSFKDQFKGHSPSDIKKLGRDIRIIAGATISCSSLIEEVRRKLIYLEVMTEKKPVKTSFNGITESANELSPAQASDEENEAAFKKRGRMLMGTFLEIQAFGTSESVLNTAMNRAFDEVDRIEQLLSTYKSESEISQLNLHGAHKPVTLSREVYDLLERSKQITDQTQGAFDITVGPIVRLWRQSDGTVPSKEKINDSLQHIGMHHIHLDSEQQSVWFDTEGVQVDLGGIGKGYAMDRAADILKAHGIKRALLSFGGHILALDPPPGRDGWQVSIRDPEHEVATLKDLVFKNASLATTADDQRGYWIHGKRYSHIINPQTGQPVEGRSSVTVITKNAEQGDAFSTALFATNNPTIDKIALKTTTPLAPGSMLYSQFP